MPKLYLKYFVIFSFILLNSKVGAIDIYVKQVNLPGDVKASSINVLLPDSLGFLWLGTANGLFRWDGNRLEEYPVLNNSNSVNITSMTLDKDGVVWTGCENGSMYFVSDDGLKNWKPVDTGVFTKITDLLFDKGGKLWWGTNGAGLFHSEGDKIIRIGLEDGLPDEYIYSLENGNFGEIWASTDRGVAVCKSWENLNEVNFFDTKTGLNDDIVRVVKKDRKGNLWLGFHEGGICFLSNTTKKFIDIPAFLSSNNGQVNEIAVDKDGLWVAMSNGLFFYDQRDSTKNSVTFHGENLPARIKTVSADKFGNLWLLDKESLFVSSAGAFTRIKQKFGYDITKAKAIAMADNENVWLAENNYIVKITEDEIRNFLSGLLGNTTGITAIKSDENGNFWFSTFGEGVIVFNPKTEKYRFITEQNGLVNNSVLDISIRGNEIWFATLGGASRINSKNIWQTNKFKIDSYNKERGLGNNFIYNILQDSKGNVWFGTDGNGLVKFTDGTFTFFDETSGLNDDVVYSIAEDKDGDIWISTASSGLYCFNGNTFKRYTTPDYLISSTIFALATWNEFVFALTDLGLNIINKTNGVSTSINEELNLKKINADLNKVYTGDDFICFLTQQGIIRINTHRFSEYIKRPQLVIDKVLINLETVRIDDISTLSSDENRIVFEYNGFWYMAPSKVHYSVRLDGYDPEWKTTYDRRISFANLSPGSYSFEGEAYLDNVLSAGQQIKLQFQILKPFYARWWFIFLVGLAVLVIFYIMIKLRENRLKLSESRKKEKLEFEFQTLKNQINPHFLFNSFSTLISTIEENPQIAVEYTEKLSDFFRNILEVKEQELIPIEEELEMIKNYYYLQHKRFGDNFLLTIHLDADVRKSVVPPLTLQLLTENAIKHNIVSKNKPLEVSITNNQHSIFVKNNLQKKNQTEKSIGVGLQNIKERYRLLTGKEVEVEEGKTFFKVILPIIKS